MFFWDVGRAGRYGEICRVRLEFRAVSAAVQSIAILYVCLYVVLLLFLLHIIYVDIERRSIASREPSLPPSCSPINCNYIPTYSTARQIPGLENIHESTPHTRYIRVCM